MIGPNRTLTYHMHQLYTYHLRSILKLPSGCTAHAAAYDGVWRFQVPKMTSSNEHTMSGASRLDVAIKCSSGGDVTFNRKVVATLNVADGTPSSANPFTSDSSGNGSSWPSARPNYLRDLSQETEWETYDIAMTASQLNGVTYSSTTPLLTRAYGTLQEWTIKSSQSHPYHLHVYHIQVKVGGCGVSCLRLRLCLLV